MDEVEWEETLRRALLEAIREDYKGILDATDETEINFTSGYERRMRKLLADPFRYAKKISRPVWKQVLHTVACILLTISIGFGGILAISPEARATVLRWVIEWYQDHITYQFTGDAVTETTDWVIGDLPDGFKEVSREDLFGMVTIIYENQDNMQIDFTYSPLTEGVAYEMDSQNYTMWETTINGMKAYAAEAEISTKRNYIIWMDEEEQVVFSLTSHLDINKLMQIGKTIKLVN